MVVQRHPLPHLTVSEEVVHPQRARSLEAVAGRLDIEVAFETGQAGRQFVEQVGLDGVLDDGVAIALHPADMGIDIVDLLWFGTTEDTLDQAKKFMDEVAPKV